MFKAFDPEILALRIYSKKKNQTKENIYWEEWKMFNHQEIVTLTYIYFKGYDTKNQEQHEQLLNYSHK